MSIDNEKLICVFYGKLEGFNEMFHMFSDFGRLVFLDHVSRFMDYY